LLNTASDTNKLKLNINNYLNCYESSTINFDFFFKISNIFFSKNLNVKKKSAFELAKTNIGNMRRLRVTKGICLPSDYPIHIICGSKDVIHSWAIPGLGVKIDCIPGYNSHRRVLFRWRGIY